MALPKTFSDIGVDAQGREFVTYKPTGTRYYINRKLDPQVRSTVGLSTAPRDYRGPVGRAPAPAAIHASAPAPVSMREPAPVPVPARRVIVARFIKGSAPRTK
jgi:hypothetical protein